MSKVNPKSLQNLNPFKPGESGNPAGSKKGPRFKTVIKELLEMKGILTDDDMDKEFVQLIAKRLGRELTNREVIVAKQVKKALQGDTTAFEKIADREEGKPAQTNVNHNIGQSYTEYLDGLKEAENEED